MILHAASQKFLYLTVSLKVLMPSRACMSRLKFLGFIYNYWKVSFFPLRMLQMLTLSQRWSAQPWVLSLVLMTSSGVVGMEAIAPAIPPQRQYFKPWLPSFTPKQCFKVSLKATMSDPNGIFIAQLTGKLRQKAIAPSRFRTDETTYKMETFNFSDLINCMRCFNTSVGVIMRSWNIAETAPTKASFPKSSPPSHSRPCKALSYIEKQMAWAGAHPRATIDEPAQKLLIPPAPYIFLTICGMEKRFPTWQCVLTLSIGIMERCSLSPASEPAEW